MPASGTGPGAVNIRLDSSAIGNLAFALNVLLTREQAGRGLQAAFKNAAKVLQYALKKENQSRPTYGHSILGNPTYASFAAATTSTTRLVTPRGSKDKVLVVKVGLKRTELPGRGSRKVIRPWKYWHLVNLGTKPHWQPIRRVQHPGARPQPIRNDVVVANKAKIQESVRRNLQRYIRTNFPFKAKAFGI